ncbi:dTDP-4-dehydrorhamnose reductase [Arsukibacterium tuosuense]|uniref:dTDP-4-dehydrorhamnose reductase n=1 Tax=Arsukibacterium tuosuense TaxID=1323745 RepID=A0A285IV10_9GAMM|nr:dTDP-4-dehydrorhamnose reductase [Arsukibacterium tuosuense]SNY51880.1 dTDP-4-dehydrorhamnose reductase [Arsukibacterium tuosuense]
MTSRILILGASGQLGQALLAEVGLLPATIRSLFDFIPRQALDLTDRTALKSCLQKHSPAIIINACAYTAVDNAEQHIALAWRLNQQLTAELSQYAKASGAALLHFSTDYVFNGLNQRPYTETDRPAPLNQYGKSKLAGEQAMLDIAPAGLIIRTSWLYSEFGHNFARSIWNKIQQGEALRVVNDQTGSPTYARELAACCLKLVTADNFAKRFASTQLMHCAGSGQASWYQFALEILRLSGRHVTIAAVSSQQWPTRAQRPAYSALSSARLQQQFGLSLPAWQHSLARCIEKMGLSE